MSSGKTRRDLLWGLVTGAAAVGLGAEGSQTGCDGNICDLCDPRYPDSTDPCWSRAEGCYDDKGCSLSEPDCPPCGDDDTTSDDDVAGDDDAVEPEDCNLCDQSRALCKQEDRKFVPEDCLVISEEELFVDSRRSLIISASPCLTQCSGLNAPGRATNVELLRSVLAEERIDQFCFPCMEVELLGLLRGGFCLEEDPSHERLVGLLSTEAKMARMRHEAAKFANRAYELAWYGYRIGAILLTEYSPVCGVNFNKAGFPGGSLPQAGAGIFTQMLQDAFVEYDLLAEVPFWAVDRARFTNNMEQICTDLRGLCAIGGGG